MEQHGAKGFIGFYSTVPSSGLEERLNKLAIGHRVFDRESIEAKLLSEDPRLREVFARYFPKSYANFRKDSKTLVRVLDTHVPLKCDVCQHDLMQLREVEGERLHHGVIGIVKKNGPPQRGSIMAVYAACKGPCDRRLERSYWKQFQCLTGWLDIDHLTIPGLFITEQIGIMNGLRSGNKYEDSAFKGLIEMMIAISQSVVRDMTVEERTTMRKLLELQF